MVDELLLRVGGSAAAVLAARALEPQPEAALGGGGFSRGRWSH
jgi:hypothetical protein